MRGVYPLTAMMNSVCNPNTQNCIDRNFVCRVRAAVPIKKGQEITATYTLTLAGTMYRQKHLMDSKYFVCQCARCTDPTGNIFRIFFQLINIMMIFRFQNLVAILVAFSVNIVVKELC